MKKNIIFIGYMGAGKTTIGKMLSEQLGWSLVDTDEKIEEKAGKRIARIFEEEGEECFRQMETSVLKELLSEADTMVISVGGGLPVREENRRMLKELGLVVYLQVTPETVAKRLTGDQTRPLLENRDIQKRAEEMLPLRDPFYQETANVTISCDGKEKNDILSEISQKLLEFFIEG